MNETQNSTQTRNLSERIYLSNPHTGAVVCIPTNGEQGCAGYTLEASMKTSPKRKTHYGHDGARYSVMTTEEINERAEWLLTNLDLTRLCDCR